MTHTCMEKPTPTPNKSLPIVSIKIFTEKPLMAAPTRKIKPPRSIDIFRPNRLVTHDAKREATCRAAKYKEEVNMVSFISSNL